MDEIQRYHWTSSGMQRNASPHLDKMPGVEFVRGSSLAAALEAQAEEHSEAIREQDKGWGESFREEQELHKRNLEAQTEEHRVELAKWDVEMGKLEADLAALRGKGEPALIRFEHPHLIGEPCMIHRDYRPAMDRLCNIAGRCDVEIFVTHSMRRLNQKLFDTVVKEAERSNHHAGSAIDMNPVYQGVWYTSELMAGTSMPPPVVRFLNAVVDDPDLRWGGDFGVNKDRVHIDDNLVRRDPAEWRRRVEQLRGERV